MTLKEFMTKMLTDRGMSDDEAKSIMEEAIPDIEHRLPLYNPTWERPTDEYPELLTRILWVEIQKIASDWLIRNQPAL